ncbi:hypothetical protein MSAN_00850900 [Mycena sanguinolenta]|uniref:Uncharacterized protein n=1 Tax=Mycena sanguinolenta TaxID=230812 RepID=A0A8H6Z006_9AGAR|nr:hypothetical protein MSAN_00850900 [Mycena sanguinolenta]
MRDEGSAGTRCLNLLKTSTSQSSQPIVVIPHFPFPSSRMLTIPRAPAALATAVIETFFYGAYFVLFQTSLFLLFTRRFRPDRSIWLSPILCGGIVLFIAVTGHWILSIHRLFLAFVTLNDPVQFYGDFSQPTEIIQTGFLLASLTIVDTLFVHRLWTVWAHNRYVMIFPTATLLGLVICALGVIYDFSQFKVGDDVYALANGWIIADCALTSWYVSSFLSLFTYNLNNSDPIHYSTNIYCTAMIALRLWRVQRILTPVRVGGSILMSVVNIIVESAALSAAWAFFFVITYATHSNLRFLIDVTPAIVGTANMLIYVRVGLGWAYAPTETNSSTTSRPLRFNVSKSYNAQPRGECEVKEVIDIVWYVAVSCFGPSKAHARHQDQNADM